MGPCTRRSSARSRLSNSKTTSSRPVLRAHRRKLVRASCHYRIRISRNNQWQRSRDRWTRPRLRIAFCHGRWLQFSTTSSTSRLSAISCDVNATTFATWPCVFPSPCLTLDFPTAPGAVIRVRFLDQVLCSDSVGAYARRVYQAVGQGAVEGCVLCVLASTRARACVCARTKIWLQAGTCTWTGIRFFS